MKFGTPSPINATALTGRRGRAGFTLAEVLAALLFMAIVIPVAVEAMHIASRAGTVAERKSEAARVAERVLNECIVTTNWSSGVSQDGTVVEGNHEFRWSVHDDSWSLDPNLTTLHLLSAKVEFTAQNRPYSVTLSTIVDSAVSTNSSSSP